VTHIETIVNNNEIQEIRDQLSKFRDEQLKSNFREIELSKKVTELSEKCDKLAKNQEKQLISAPPDLSEIWKKLRDLERKLIAIKNQTNKFTEEKSQELLKNFERHFTEINEKTADFSENIQKIYKNYDEIKITKEILDINKKELENNLQQEIKKIDKKFYNEHENLKELITKIEKNLEKSIEEKNEQILNLGEEYKNTEENNMKKITEILVNSIAETKEKIDNEFSTKFNEISTQYDNLVNNDIQNLANSIVELDKSKVNLENSITEIKKSLNKKRSLSIAAPIIAPTNLIENTCKIDNLDAKLNTFKNTIGNEISCYAQEVKLLRESVRVLLQKNGLSAQYLEPKRHMPSASVCDFQKIQINSKPQIVNLNNRGLLKSGQFTGLTERGPSSSNIVWEALKSPVMSENMSILFPTSVR